jgi:hypothetical protein
MGRALDWVVCLVGGVFVGVARPAAAAPPRSTVGVSYSADAQCPAAPSFLTQVRTRAPQVDLVERRADARFSVVVRTDARGAIGQLEMRAADGAITSREVRGDSCEGVVTALALVTALAVASPSSSDDATGSTSSSPHARTPTSPSTVDVPPARPFRSEPADTAAKPHARGTHAWRWGLGAALGAMGGVAPDFVGVGEAFVDLRRERDAFPLQFRLHASAVPPQTRTYAWGAATIRLVTAGLDACALGASLGAGLRVMPCAGFELGPLAVEGNVTELGGTSSQANWWWADASAIARAEWSVADALQFDLQGGAVFPLIRSTYVIDSPETRIHSVPPAALAVFVGATVHLP